MDLSIAAILAQDGVTSGAIYALLALALVLVFSVTRVIFIPQGEFVAYGALTLAAIQANKAPLSASMLVALGVLTFLVEMGRTLLQPELRLHALRTGVIYAGKYLVFPLAVYAAANALSPMTLPMAAQVALALLIVIPMGPMISVGVQSTKVGLGLVMFGAEGSRTDAFSDARFDLGALSVSGQSLWVVAVSVLMIVALYFYFGRTVSGKALRATAVNRLGARLVGIGTTQAGRLAFTLAAALGALCGILIAPLTTVYYESGFLIGLKGFVGAIVGGLVSYPVAALGALLVGLLESYSSFWASAFKEVIVFTLIIPVLLWRSLTTKHVEEEE